MIAVPVPAPVTTPDTEPIVAIAGAELIHEPPAATSFNVMEELTQVPAGPVIAGIDAA